MDLHLMKHIRHMSDEVKLFSQYAQAENSLTYEAQNSQRLILMKNKVYYSMWFCFENFKDLLNYLFWDPSSPEFTSLQQFNWALLIGIFMGVFTAFWALIIERSVEFVWVDVPEKLVEWGIFTDLDGYLPLPHYMWICPACFGAVLSFITQKLQTPIPTQDSWIDTLHRIGIQESKACIPLLIISTLAMASGLSLGPELPLVLFTGMIGSQIAIFTKQSVLSARVMNLTAAGAGVGGFFGFPMAGALFVLELPHCIGLQYFEALSPAVISSIVAVLVNQIVTGNEVKGYFNYPFLSTTLPSHIYYVAVFDGLVSTLFGIVYVVSCKKLKTWVHDWFHYEKGEEFQEVPINTIVKKKKIIQNKNEPIRATVVGFIAGALTTIKV